MMSLPRRLATGIAALRQAARIRATERELRALGPALLWDIGIAPQQVPLVAEGLLTCRAEPAVPAAAERRSAEVVPLLQRREPVPLCTPACCAA